ncbi:MAG: PQQ-like beta-propeller repeat protein [Candidatus Coatesbacteria bacterium]|nr:PQQ-like beta-propeller repeat protein [Candidatus Coatesbacteria bacterium]
MENKGIVTDSDGNFYFAAIDEEGNADTHFHSLDMNGNPRWEKKFRPSGNPNYTILDDTRKQLYFQALTTLEAYTTDGDLIWTKTGTGYAHQLVLSEKGNIYANSGWLYKISPDGTTIWEKDYRIHYEKTPAIDIDETCYIIDEKSVLNCIDSLGELKWTFNLGTLTGTQSISIGDSTIYYVCDKNLLCIRKDGTEKWRYGFDKIEYYAEGTPSITSEGNIVFRNGNYIYCFKLDGSIKFQWDGGQKYTNHYPIIIDKEDRIYEMDVCLDKEGNVVWNYGGDYDENLIMDKYGRLVKTFSNIFYYGVNCYKDPSGFSNNNSSSSLPSRSLSVSPNPFSSRLSLSLPSSGAIYFITGQLIMNLDKGKHSLDTSSWREGIYIVKSGKECKRVVKVN